MSDDSKGLDAWAPNGGEPFFGLDRSGDLPGFFITYKLPKRSLLTRVKQSWRAAVDAWQYGFDEGNDE